MFSNWTLDVSYRRSSVLYIFSIEPPVVQIEIKSSPDVDARLCLDFDSPYFPHELRCVWELHSLTVFAR